jgi:RNA polymerase sigma-70 factor (ECF subfamily)
VRAFCSRDRYDDRLAALAWLRGIARNVLLGHFRAQHAIAAADTGRRHPGEPDPWDAVDNRLDARRTVSSLTEALAVLSDEDREVLLLLAWEQLTSADGGRARHPPDHSSQTSRAGCSPEWKEQFG